MEIIQKSGSWFSYNNEKIGQGKEQTILYLKANPKVLNELEAKVRAQSQKQKAENEAQSTLKK